MGNMESSQPNDSPERVAGITKILIIEDNRLLAGELKDLLEENGYAATVMDSFDDVVEQILGSDAGLVLLDINIPGVNGEQVLRRVRQSSQVPIIMLTSKNTEADEILSMSYGADDFVSKPFRPTILVLRIEAVLNRTRSNRESSVTRYRDLGLYRDRNAIAYKGSELDLTRNEFVILSYMVKNHGRIVSRAELTDYLWDDEQFVDDNTLTVNMTRLRDRLKTVGLPDLIKTRRALGYILE